MKQDNIKTRRIKEFKDFKESIDKFQSSGDSKRIESEKELDKAHPGMKKIKSEKAYTKHDSNYYHAAGIPVEEESDESNNYVKAKGKMPKVLSDEEQESVDKRDKGYSENGYVYESKKKKSKKKKKTTIPEEYYNAGMPDGPMGDTSFDGVSEKSNKLNKSNKLKKTKKIMEKRFGKIHSFQSFVNEAYNDIFSKNEDNDFYGSDTPSEKDYENYLKDYLNSGELSKEEYKEWIDSTPNDLRTFLSWMIYMWIESERQFSKEDILTVVKLFQDYIDQGFIEEDNHDLYLHTLKDLLDIVNFANSNAPDSPQRKKDRKIIDSLVG